MNLEPGTPDMRIPTATYRLQLHKDFAFAQVAEIIDYLHALGISDLYASPILKARAGSVHGYDVVDPNQINPELDDSESFSALSAELRKRDMGWIQDIVPNHMAYDCNNRLLADVLENGPNSQFARFFDIEWDNPDETLRGRVLAPFLGKFYGACLEDGELVLQYDADGLAVHYYQQRFPLNIESYGQVLAPSVTLFRRKLGRQHPDLIKLLGVLYTIKNLPSHEENRERADQIAFIKSMFWGLYTGNDEIKALFDQNIAVFNGRPGDAESFNALDHLLGQQYYRLSFWKVATEEINYRRFFNINDLISLRIEDWEVFDVAHALLLKLVQEGKITGLRIDHIDGLYDPLTYLKRIRERIGELYVVVEKILDPDEELPANWPVCGTTGYDFAHHVSAIFCQSVNEEPFSQIYSRFTGLRPVYSDLVTGKKRLIIGRHMAGDVDRLAHLLKRVSSRDRFGGDITLYGLKRALVEVLALFPVYRTYVSFDHFSDVDRELIRGVMKRALELNPALAYELSFIGKFLLLEHGDQLPSEERNHWISFIMRLQQLTGPLMAKGFEDTTLYIYNRLLSLNEVGSKPDHFGLSLPDFHRFNEQRSRQWPHSMNATSTHDTKRGEDARARINVLSEIPEEWQAQLSRWSELNRRHKQVIKGQPVPDRNDEYFFYQSVIGAWPFGGDPTEFVERAKAYMIKAVREAKVHTEWLKPDDAYEAAFLAFIERTLDPGEANRFLPVFLPFARRVAFCGVLNSLAQTLLKITSSGVPDFYQGTDLWELSFVDPDNRRPVDFARRRALLEELQRQRSSDRTGLVRDLLARWEDGKIKLYLISSALNFRRSHSWLFQQGSYLPLSVSESRKDNLCAFARNSESDWSIVLAPRFTAPLVEPETWPLREFWRGNTVILPAGAPRRWLNIFTGEEVVVSGTDREKLLDLSSALGTFPVALLIASAD
ncbi:MAG TPA: malto-oligosyltrehalose synthase [Candidatus Acidoferrales bacterium]|nr:malto-oligosyltrehalose synthase [Candidatus Acidoferrales bacterium]